MDLGWVGMTQVWSEEVRTSRWTSRWTSSRPTGGASGSTSGSLKFSDGLRKTSGLFPTSLLKIKKSFKVQLSLTLMRVKLVFSIFIITLKKGL